jgi:hypothetical protein
MKVSIYPLKDYIIEFINTRGITLASHEEKLDVLFYTGSDFKELKELVKDTEPDFVILNNMRVGDNVGFNWIRHEFDNLITLLRPDIIYTNEEVLARELYSLWGIQTDVSSTKKIQAKKKNISSIFSNIKEVMLWE